MSSIQPTPDDRRAEYSGVLRAWTSIGDRRGKSQSVSPIVTVFGAGIAGLSTAHELIERGFSVQVVEPTHSPDEEYGVEVGGLARNQFGRVPENPLVLHHSDPSRETKPEEFQDNIEKILMLRTTQMRRVQRRFPVPLRIVFNRGSAGPDVDLYQRDEWGVTNRRKLFTVWQTLTEAYRTYKHDFEQQQSERSLWYYEKELPPDWRCREILFVEIRGHTNRDDNEATNRALSLSWANAVWRQLARLNKDGPNPIDDFESHFKAVAVGSAEPLGDQRDEVARKRSNRVEFRIVEEFIPGEHGYRFFPAFYRHLFDTMQRTPILDQHNHESGQTAYDRLVPTREFGLAPSDGGATATIETRPPRSLEELRKHSELFLRRLGVTQRDIARFEVRMLKFLTSSSERRRREYQDQSFWTYIGGDAERGYSEKMARYLMEAPQALVAMNARETDARSQGNIVSQLQLHHMERRSDMTLNGPTSQVWLREWKRYLQRQGVRFFHGELGKLHWHDDELSPLAARRSGWLEATGSIADRTAPADVPAITFPLPRPQRPKVEIEVLESDDGDYAILVGKDLYSVSAHRSSRHCIAKGLAATIDNGKVVAATVPTAFDTRIVITEKREVRLDVPAPPKALEFDDSFIAGSWQRVRTIRRQDLLAAIPAADRRALRDDIERAGRILAAVNNLRDKLPRTSTTCGALDRLLALVDEVNVSLNFSRLREESFKQDLADITAEQEKQALDAALALLKKAAGLRRGSQEPGTPRSTRPPGDTLLDDSRWVYAGRLRADPKDAAFDTLLNTFEMIRRPRRELVPKIDVQGTKAFVLSPPSWVEKADRAEGDAATNFAPLFPYYFRTHRPSDLDDGSLWIQLRNANDNLRVLAEPVPEDPTHRYMSDLTGRSAFHPDFYVLALPFDKASKIVWRAEAEQPGCLDGCLAELLDFDRQTYRRSQTGDELAVVRDRLGRPPKHHPLRDFSGVQYYFHNQVRIGKGHLYFPDAEWGLSSISQLAYWRERMSPTGPFMGQLSVDIGNFYAPAAPRDAGRFGRTAWGSSYGEIVTEVWDEVRLGLERQRAGVLIPPDYVHVDEGLRFNDPRGSSFRERAAIVVKPGTQRGDYTIRINREAFTWVKREAAGAAEKGTCRSIAHSLRDRINNAPFGSTQAEVQRKSVSQDIKPEAIIYKDEPEALKMIAEASLQDLDVMEAAERENPTVSANRECIKKAISDRRPELWKKANDIPDPNSDCVVMVRSTVPVGAALVFVSGADAGSYELVVGERSFRYAALRSPGKQKTQEESLSEESSSDQECSEEKIPEEDIRKETIRKKKIRDGLFEQLVQHLNLPVTPALSGDTGLLLLPRGTDELPAIMVRNDHQNLGLVYGPTLHIRLEQDYGGLSFDAGERATIGYNDTPFLINLPSQWEYRPGVLQPDRLAFEERRTDLPLDHRVFYRVSKRRWVAAGTYMATTTRLTTMEAANESGRHAVNAILNRMLVRPNGDYNAQGRMFADWAEIWDPEKHELDDLEPLKRLDERLVADGLPHVLDILKVLDAIDALPMHGKASADPMASITQLLQHAANASDQDWGFLKETLQYFITHAAERVHGGLDPLGVLRANNSAPGDLMDRIKSALRTLLNVSGPAPTGGNAGSAPTDSR